MIAHIEATKVASHLYCTRQEHPSDRIVRFFFSIKIRLARVSVQARGWPLLKFV
jgi:hypothetical protein